MKSICPILVVGKGGMRCVLHAMTLYIGLIDEIQPILCTEIIPLRSVGIVTGSNGINISLLHQPDILKHAFYRYGTAGAGIVFVPVHPLEQH